MYSKEILENKKVVVIKKGKPFYYTIASITEINDMHVLFKDKFGHDIMIKLSDIHEVY